MSALDAARLRELLLAPHGAYAALEVVGSTGSTNTDLAAAARQGAADRTVLVAEHQTAGRGRGSRAWSQPPGVGLSFSVLLRPGGVPAARLGWVPLLAGVALATAVRATAGVEAKLKWPNDLLVNGRKCAGILAEAHNGALVVGIGLNVTQRPDELPAGVEATSLAMEGATCLARVALLVAVLQALDQHERRWRSHSGDPQASGLYAAYTESCATIGERVEVSLPAGTTIAGIASGIDADGRLLVAGTAVSAGDVIHVRRAPA